jgi:hypothetical protein
MPITRSGSIIALIMVKIGTWKYFKKLTFPLTIKGKYDILYLHKDFRKVFIVEVMRPQGEIDWP